MGKVNWFGIDAHIHMWYYLLIFCSVQGVRILEDIIIGSMNYAPYLAYSGIFTVLILCGLGLPLPEESVIIAGGYLASSGFLNDYISMTICMFGVLIGDYIIFSIGKRWGSGVISSRYLQRAFTPRRLVRVRKFFRKHGNSTIFIARFISGFRIAAFITAGMMKIKDRTFMTIDLLAALISVPLFFISGYLLHNHLESLLQTVKDINRLLLFMVLVVIVIYLLYRRRKRISR